jgi:hypothetical protein
MMNFFSPDPASGSTVSSRKACGYLHGRRR